LIIWTKYVIMDYEVASCKMADFSQSDTQILARDNLLHFKAHRWSMYPSIGGGDVVGVKPLQASAVGLEEMVVCGYGEDSLVVHLAIGVSRENGRAALAIEGGLGRHSDRPICPEQMLGQVTAIDKSGKRCL
jgi:hypothetical protein